MVGGSAAAAAAAVARVGKRRSRRGRLSRDGRERRTIRRTLHQGPGRDDEDDGQHDDADVEHGQRSFRDAYGVYSVIGWNGGPIRRERERERGVLAVRRGRGGQPKCRPRNEWRRAGAADAPVPQRPRASLNLVFETNEPCLARRHSSKPGQHETPCCVQLRPRSSRRSLKVCA